MAKVLETFEEEAKRRIAKVVKDFEALRPKLSNDQRRGRGFFTDRSRERLGQITAVTGTANQPLYSAQAIRNNSIIVTSERPFATPANTETRTDPASVGDECGLFRGVDDNWHISWTSETLATDSCQDIAGRRSNIAVTTITASTTAAIIEDWIECDATLAPIVLTLNEDEIGKPYLVTKIDPTANPVTINNQVNGQPFLVITNQYDAADLAFNGTEWRLH